MVQKKERQRVFKIWVGMDFFGRMRLLIHNRFDAYLPYLPTVLFFTFMSISNTLLRYLKNLIYGRRINKIEIKDPPLFIIGHWRSGTTLLHELLALDDRHTFPNYYQCLGSNHFLLTESFYKPLLKSFLPARRVMDNMTVGWEKPVEDEVALCNLGVPSPYLTMVFPNHPPQYTEYFDLETLDQKRLSSWCQTWVRFLKEITLKNPKRIVLKSPTHSFRIKTLLKLFPTAKFVHIVRNPYVIFPSTIHLWKSMYRTQGFQRPNFNGLEDYVFETFLKLYEKLEAGKTLLKPSQFYELKYEDLVRDPIGQMGLLYDHLALGEFNKVLPALKQYLADKADYQTNPYELPEPIRNEITQRWGAIINKYGYSPEAPVGSITGAGLKIETTA